MKICVTCDEMEPLNIELPTTYNTKLDWYPKEGKLSITNHDGSCVAEICIPIGKELISVSLKN